MIILQTVGGISLPQRFIFLSVGKVYGDNEALNEIPFSVCLIKFSVLFIHAPRYLFRLTLARRQVFFPSIWAIDSARTPFLYRWNMNTRKQRNTTTNTTVKMRKALKEKKKKEEIYPKIRIAKRKKTFWYPRRRIPNHTHKHYQLNLKIYNNNKYPYFPASLLFFSPPYFKHFFQTFFRQNTSNDGRERIKKRGRRLIDSQNGRESEIAKDWEFARVWWSPTKDTRNTRAYLRSMCNV